jgi:RNA polymerase sigma-70 factor (ECF subfamily)
VEELSECIPSPDRDGAALADDIVIRQALNRFLGRLPRDARIVFLRRYFYMESVEKIADACGWTQSKITVTLSRLRQKLRQELKKEGIDV